MTTPEQRRVKELEDEVKAVRADLAQINTQLAVQTMMLTFMRDVARAGQEERGKLWQETRANGSQPIARTNEIEEQGRIINEMKPILTGLHVKENMSAGAWKFASILTRAVWAVGGA